MIADVGTRGELGSDEHHDESVILPGFVNAHTHLEYAVYAGFGDGLRFADWIGLHVERKLRIELEDMEAIARLGALDCLRSGITTVGDCSFSGAAAMACADLGLKGTIYLEVFGPTDSPIRERFEPMRERIAGALSDDVRLGISPHAPYTCTIDLYRASAELGLPVATHLAESDDETEFLRTGRGGWESFADMLVPPPGTTGIRALAEAGLLDSNVLAAHCVKADEEEIEILAAHDVAVAHCPRSNGILGCGVAPLTALREAGIRVCIATDSPASTPSFDMFDEMRAAIVGARAREGRPDALTAADALELATLGGARALGVDASRGSIVVRKAGGSDRPLARGHAVHPVGRSCYGSRSRRIPSRRRRYSRVRQTAVCEGREDMARADRRRAQRTRPAPAARRSDVVIEDTMFFPRLRRHAKWMFLFLAIVFALGFVGFGVGAGGVGFGDVIRDAAGGGGTPSVSDAEKRVLDNPKDAQAFKDLSTAQQAAGNTDGAIEALQNYVQLRPKNTDVLRELAALYLQQASVAQERAQILEARAAYLAPGTIRDTIFQLGGSPLQPDPITNALSTSYQTKISAANSEIQTASAQAVEQYRRIAEIQPKDPSVQLELASAATSANDVATTIAAYKAFLKLAPDDPTAPEVRRILKQIQRFAQTG